MKDKILTGRIILMTDAGVLLSPIFQGETYPDANGKEFISYLSQIYSERHFRKYIKRISKTKYGSFDANDNISKLKLCELISGVSLDFTYLDYETIVCSDWLYVKNIRNQQLPIQSSDGYKINLEPNETVAVCQGKLLPYPFKKPLKERDTINPIILTEKIN